jgi:hypothetical protein
MDTDKIRIRATRFVMASPRFSWLEAFWLGIYSERGEKIKENLLDDVSL